MPNASSITIASLALLAGCADFGPFRARGDSEGGSGGSSDGGAVDGSMPSSDGPRAMPVVIATDGGDPIDLAVANGYVYWVAGQAIHRVASAGGNVQSLAAQGYVNHLAVVGSKLAWTTTDGVWKSEGFAPATALATSRVQTSYIAASNDHVYYPNGDSDHRALERVAWTGGTPEPIRDTGSIFSQVVVGGTSVYWTGYATNTSELRRASLSSPTSSMQLTTSDGLGGLRASSSVACWIEQPDPNLYAYDIWCWRNNGRVRIAQGRYQIFEMAVTDTAVYYAARVNQVTAHLFRYSFATQATTQHDTSGPGPIPYAVAVDSSYLYSFEADGDARTLWRQPLP